MLDNRYESDSDSIFGSGDVLGEDQWIWLDLALKRGKGRKVSMTVIGAGIQMVPERLNVPFIENFREVNRLQLYKALKTNEMENVVLISGDVHLGQIYHA